MFKFLTIFVFSTLIISSSHADYNKASGCGYPGANSTDMEKEQVAGRCLIGHIKECKSNLEIEGKDMKKISNLEVLFDQDAVGNPADMVFIKFRCAGKKKRDISSVNTSEIQKDVSKKSPSKATSPSATQQ